LNNSASFFSRGVGAKVKDDFYFFMFLVFVFVVFFFLLGVSFGIEPWG
jgi:hypothetical protein